MTRARWMFHLAHLCHCPPPVVDVMTVGDFARLVTGVQEYERAASAGGT